MAKDRRQFLIAAIMCWLVVLFSFLWDGCMPGKKPVMVTGEQVKPPSGWVEYQERREK